MGSMVLNKGKRIKSKREDEEFMIERNQPFYRCPIKFRNMVIDRMLICRCKLLCLTIYFLLELITIVTAFSLAYQREETELW